MVLCEKGNSVINKVSKMITKKFNLTGLQKRIIEGANNSENILEVINHLTINERLKGASEIK